MGRSIKMTWSHAYSDGSDMKRWGKITEHVADGENGPRSLEDEISTRLSVQSFYPVASALFAMASFAMASFATALSSFGCRRTEIEYPSRLIGSSASCAQSFEGGCSTCSTSRKPCVCSNTFLFLRCTSPFLCWLL